MRFFIVDDSDSDRSLLRNMIEEELGTVVGEAADGSEISIDILKEKEVDILLIDMLMPQQDGLETIRKIFPSFKGKIIMISQVETKDLIGEAYSLGVEYYVTKPMNRLELVNIIQKAAKSLQMERTIQNIQQSLSFLEYHHYNDLNKTGHRQTSSPITSSGKEILLELGIISVSGSKDLLDMLSILYQMEKEGIQKIPSLRELYRKVIEKRHGSSLPSRHFKREIKAAEQRTRRAVHEALEHVASLGLTDWTNPKFENFSSKFFDYTQVRLKMLELEGKAPQTDGRRINIKKFVHALYHEAKQRVP